MLAYVAAKRQTQDNSHKAMKHFGGLKLHGGSVVCKCDDAEEIEGAAHLEGWIVLSTVSHDWSHSTHCERDIGVKK